MNGMSSISKFTYEEYERFIEHARNIAPICALRDWKGKNGIILRHDVDFDVESARRLSLVEKKMEVPSTYFVMASNRYYNPLFPSNSKLLLALARDGFEVGLHFDPSIYGNIPASELEEKMKLECSILESAIGEPIESVSLHNPSLSGQYPMFKGYHNAYSTEIFSDENYMSDSCMGFRGKDPYEFVKKASKMPLQMVFHPMHWSEKGDDYIDYFTNYILELTDYMDDTMRVNQKYKELIGNTRLVDSIARGINDRNKNK